MAKELTEKQFYRRELTHNSTFRYLNATQRRDRYERYLNEIRQAEENAHKKRLDQERQAQEIRAAEDEIRHQIKEFGQIQSAKIARHVTAAFDATEVLELIDFFESQAQLHEAVIECHAKLEPDYRREIVSWCLKNTSLQSNQLEDSAAVNQMIARCMQQGLSAICKSGPLGERLAAYKPTSGVEVEAENKTAIKIERRRSWKEISAENN